MGRAHFLLAIDHESLFSGGGDGFILAVGRRGGERGGGAATCLSG